MSLFELKERLALLKEAQQKEQLEKWEKILKERQRNEKMLSEKQEAINLQKRALAHAAALRQGRHRQLQCGNNGVCCGHAHKYTCFTPVVILCTTQEGGEESQAADG